MLVIIYIPTLEYSLLVGKLTDFLLYSACQCTNNVYLQSMYVLLNLIILKSLMQYLFLTYFRSSMQYYNNQVRNSVKDNVLVYNVLSK